MDNITPLHPTSKSQCVITLDPFQDIYYRQSFVDIHSPEGDFLERIGADIQKDNAEHQKYQLRDQVCLLNCLLGKIREDVELPREAISGLADVMHRMQDFFELHVK
jgi:hypothetical protein